jgi:hypothetical protein
MQASVCKKPLRNLRSQQILLNLFLFLRRGLPINAVATAAQA